MSDEEGCDCGQCGGHDDGDEFRDNGYPELVMKMSSAERHALLEDIDRIGSVWGTLDGTLRGIVGAALAGGEATDRTDVVRIYLDEFVDKTKVVNDMMAQRTFGRVSDPTKFAQSFHDQLQDMITTSKRYQQGMTKGLSRCLLAAVADTVVMGFKDLEKAYALTARTIEGTPKLTPADKRAFFTTCQAKCVDTWAHLCKCAKEWAMENPDKLSIDRYKHEAKHFDWLIREGMDEKEALQMAMKSGLQFMSKYSFIAWFRTEEH